GDGWTAPATPSKGVNAFFSIPCTPIGAPSCVQSRPRRRHAMNLLQTFEWLLQSWTPIFSQRRVGQRIHRLTLGLLLCLRSHCLTNAICACGRRARDWSADYRVFSRSPWNSRRLFDPIWDQLPRLLPSPTAPVLAAMDDTSVAKTGRHIPGVAMARDPMSPKFHVNLRPGLRFLQFSLLVSPPETPGPARAL